MEPRITSTNYSVTCMVSTLQNSYVMASIVKIPDDYEFNYTNVLARDARSSQEVWSTMKTGMQFKKEFIKGFSSFASSSEKIAELRFTELDPGKKYDIYLVMSSEQPIERRAVWS